MHMGLDLRQGADQASVLVEAVVVVRMQEEARIARSRRCFGRAGQDPLLIGFRSGREVEESGDSCDHQQAKAEQHADLPSALFHLTQFHCNSLF